MQLNILCVASGKWTTQLKKRQNCQHFRRKSWQKWSLRQAHITELTEMMSSVFTLRTKHQQHYNRSIAALISSWLIMSQQLFRTCFRWSMSLIFEWYTSCWVKTTTNWIIHGIQIRWVRWPVWRLNEVGKHLSSGWPPYAVFIGYAGDFIPDLWSLLAI